MFRGVIRIRSRCAWRRHSQADVRKSSRCRLPLQLRADQRADLLPHRADPVIVRHRMRITCS
jgi:hypothetical protein